MRGIGVGLALALALGVVFKGVGLEFTRRISLRPPLAKPLLEVGPDIIT